MDSTALPGSLRTLITAEVADELARVYDDQVVFPERVIVDRPDDPGRRFPGWPAPVLVIADENQGVCSWGVPLGDPNPAVLVGGELSDGEGTVEYAPEVAGYAAARRWDGWCLNREPLLQAQAAVLDEESLAPLRSGFDQRPLTHGWPGHTQYRFEREAVAILLWSGPDQCDWWLSAADDAVLLEVVARLLDLSDLAGSLWSNDVAGDALLRRVRGERAR